MRILLSILAVIAFLFLIYLAIGLFSKPEFKGQSTAEFQAPPERIYKIITDIEGLPKRRREVDRVEILEPGTDGQKRWREITDLGGYADFEILEDVRDSLITVKMSGSSFGITGIWKYEIKRQREHTLVTISEHSRCERPLVRSILVLAGRNATLKQELRNLKKVLKKEAVK